MVWGERPAFVGAEKFSNFALGLHYGQVRVEQSHTSTAKKTLHGVYLLVGNIALPKHIICANFVRL